MLKFADGGLISCKCCLILGSVNTSTHDMGIKIYNIQWVALNTTLKEKDLGLTISADMKV